MLNFAANLSWLFQEWPFLDRFAAAADAGFTAVEYLFPYDHTPDDLARLLARHGLKQVLFNLPPGDFTAGERGLAGLSGRQQEFRASVETALNYASATGTPRLHLMAGIAAGDAAMASYKDAIKFACEAAARHGIDIMIEPINGRDIPGYLMNDFELAERLIRELNLAKSQAAVRHLSPPDTAWRCDPRPGGAPAHHGPHPGRIGANASRTHHR